MTISATLSVHSRTLAVAVLAALTLGPAVPARAALIEIIVEGQWNTTHASATVNPFGLVVGDTFTMTATYDNLSFFNGPDGVTASLDPGVIPGVSFDIVIPHAAGAPNPLVFDQNDHVNIGFAAFAEIEFDGTDATTDPGSFRNFEIHTEFAFGGQSMHLDLFFFGEPQSAIFNLTQGGLLAAESSGAGHLNVVPEPSAALLLGLGVAGLAAMRRRSLLD